MKDEIRKLVERKRHGGLPSESLAGRVFSSYTVLDKWESRSTNPKKDKWETHWLCRCKCGTEKFVRAANLKTGHTKGCGCVESMRRSAPGESGFNAYVGSLTRHAKCRGFEVCLDREQIRTLATQNCHYCGAVPSRKRHTGSKQSRYRENTGFLYNGIDRVDTTKSYTIENCVTACRRCNLAKWDMTKDEFVEWAKHVARVQTSAEVERLSKQLDIALEALMHYEQKIGGRRAKAAINSINALAEIAKLEE